MNVDACAGQQVLENALAVACVRTLLFSKVLLFFSAFILEGQFRRIFTGYSSFFVAVSVLSQSIRRAVLF